MKTANDLINQPLNESQQQTGSTQTLPQLTKQDISSLWLSMAKMYGHKWVSTYGEKDDGNIWLATLGELSPDQLMIGLKRCADSGDAWPPSAPEFKSMCLPRESDYGLPSAAEAYLEATKKSLSPSMKTWSHEAVFEAGRRYGWYMLARDTQKQSEAKFTKIYAEVCKQVMAGETFDRPKSNSNMLEKHHNGEKVNTVENKKAADKALSNLKELLR